MNPSLATDLTEFIDKLVNDAPGPEERQGALETVFTLLEALNQAEQSQQEPEPDVVYDSESDEWEEVMSMDGSAGARAGRDA